MASPSSVHMEEAGGSPTESVQMGVPHVSQVPIYRCGLPCWVRLMAGVGGPGEGPFLHHHFKDTREIHSCHASDLGGVQPGHSGVSGRGPSWSATGSMQGFSEHSVLSSGDWAPVWPHMWLLTPS